MMATVGGAEWKTEMGLVGRMPPRFFSTPSEIEPSDAPQAYALQRGFADLKLDAILCLDNTPLLYFKQVKEIHPDEVWEIHRTFWNQGLAPILVLITPREVHIYSSLARPAAAGEDVSSGNRLVDRLDRVKDSVLVRQFVSSVETGEYFRVHAKSFNPDRRVDRELLRNLQATRERLDEASGGETAQVFDALLCRVVFTSYLFDREIIGRFYLEDIGITEADNLRDVFDRSNKDDAKRQVYQLFKALGSHFNGDLFSDDLVAESKFISMEHVVILERFLRGADVRTGQGSFWPYDFSIIPIETISAIYEHFLKANDAQKQKETGAFYTPRFLAEIVLDMALDGLGTLLDKRFLDPACGSGIFLVGLFNRLAEEWTRKNPDAQYDLKASGLMGILRDNLFGVDRNETACRIAAFSLYLALLDRLKPSDIRELFNKGKVLPPLIFDSAKPLTMKEGKSIIRADFFSVEAGIPVEAFDLIVGNPPWAKQSGPKSLAEKWCQRHNVNLPYRQIAQAFVWKAPFHLKPNSRICFVLPHSVIFNQQAIALECQRQWLERCSIDLVLNLADFQRFLFDAEASAVVVRYSKEPPATKEMRIEYLSPKTDWNVSHAAVISVAPEDRVELRLRDVIASLKDDRRPTLWKERYWGTPRDSKLLDRLANLPRLRESVGRAKAKHQKRWFVSQGFQPVGRGDDPNKAKRVDLPSDLFFPARNSKFELVVFEEDCEELSSKSIMVRSGSNTNTTPFLSPHVLVSQGMKVAYSDFNVSFQHAIQGIHGPEIDKPLLMFLTAYLRSPIARYFLFHATDNWGVEKATVQLDQLLTVPFLFPEQTSRPQRSADIVDTVSRTISEAAKQAQGVFTDRFGIVQDAQRIANELLYDYFEVDVVERILIEDTVSIIIPSTRPSLASNNVPTLVQSSHKQREAYKKVLCDTLNDWAEDGPCRVEGSVKVSHESGVGVVVLERFELGVSVPHVGETTEADFISLLEDLKRILKRESGSIELMRGLKVFDREKLYILKPLNQRFWTGSTALNDADEIATTILMHPLQDYPQ